MNKTEAAALLGVSPREVRSADDNWIVTADGAQYEVPSGPVARWVRSNPKELPPRFHAELVEPDDADVVEADVEEPAGEAVPDGTAAQILEWVGEDKTRAAKALAGEQAKGESARKSLVAALEKLAG